MLSLQKKIFVTESPVSMVASVAFAGRLVLPNRSAHVDLGQRGIIVN